MLFVISNYGVYILETKKKARNSIKSIALEYSWEFHQIEFFDIKEDPEHKKVFVIGRLLQI